MQVTSVSESRDGFVPAYVQSLLQPRVTFWLKKIFAGGMPTVIPPQDLGEAAALRAVSAAVSERFLNYQRQVRRLGGTPPQRPPQGHTTNNDIPSPVQSSASGSPIELPQHSKEVHMGTLSERPLSGTTQSRRQKSLKTSIGVPLGMNQNRRPQPSQDHNSSSIGARKGPFNEGKLSRGSSAERPITNSNQIDRRRSPLGHSEPNTHMGNSLERGRSPLGVGAPDSGRGASSKMGAAPFREGRSPGAVLGKKDVRTTLRVPVEDRFDSSSCYYR